MCSSSLYVEIIIITMLTSQNHEAVGESRLDKMRKFLSSPLSRKKQSNLQCKVFGTPLDVLMQRSPSEASSIPFIILRICQYIKRTGLHHEGLFRISGNARSIERLKLSFDRSGDAPLETEGDVPSAAALLKLFLRELPDPIIPLSMHKEFLNAVREKNKEECLPLLVNLVQKLPSVNYCILSYLSCFLSQVSEKEEQNRMSASSLGIVFGPNLFRVTEDFVGLKEQSLTNQIVTYFITDYRAIFKHTSEVFSTREHESPPASMVSSWPKSKASTQSMLSTWSLQPLSVSIPPIDDSYVPLSSLACTLLVPSKYDKSDSASTSCHFQEYDKKQLTTCAINLSESQLSFLKERNDMPSTSNHLHQTISKNNDDLCQSPNIVNEIDFLPESEEEIVISESQKGSSISHDDSLESVSESGKIKSSLHNLPSQGGYSSVSRKIQDNHKSYPRSHRRHVHHKKRHHSEDVMKSVEIYSDYSVEIDSSEDFLSVEGKEDRNTNFVAISSQDARHSWPVSKLQDEEDISLSPLPQQLRVAKSVEAPLSPSAFRSYLSHRTMHLDPNLPPSPPVEQEDLITGTSEEDSKRTSKYVPKTINGMKKKIKQFEENFENLYGYRPSHAEKCNNAAIKKVLSDLHKARQELKQSKYLSSPSTFEDTGDLQNKLSKSTNTRSSKPGSMSMSGDSESTPSFEESVVNASECLSRQRKEAKRPETLEEMSKEQLLAEKLAIQKILLNFESFHGRPSSKSHRELMRPLYDRYRSVKRLITRSAPSSLAKESADLLPIIEHETMDFGSVEKMLKTKNEISDSDSNSKPSFDVRSVPLKDESNSSAPQSLLHHNYHELSLSDLLKEVQVVHDEKRQLRRELRQFEDRFKQDHGRKVQREDKRAMESEYSEYKNAKAKLKLLVALVSKHESSSIS